MVDIDPLPARDVAGSRVLTDRDGEALYHNNIAMDALAVNNLEQAWLHEVQALQRSPAMSHLWVNLGAIYRQSGQHREAERSYRQALELDPNEYSAMTNLAVLYQLEGREQERAYWLARVDGHRLANPYYHAWLGDEAAGSGDWPTALLHYDKAVELMPGDSQLLFARGLIYYQLDDYEAAARNMKQAIEQATLHSDIRTYQLQLEEVRRAQLAGL
jgi:Flp pilus assembly protein TadD